MIIFDPSQSSYGNRLQTAAEVAEALKQVGGADTVVCKGACTIPSGVVWDMGNAGIVTGDAEWPAGPNLTVADGAQIRNPNIFLNLIIWVACGASGLPSLDYDDWSNGPVLTFIAADMNTEAATIPVVSVPNAAAANGFEVQFFQGSGFFNHGNVVPFAALATGTGTPGTGASLNLFVQFSEQGDIPPTFVSGDATTTLYVQGDASAFPLPAWSGFTGAFSSLNVDTAAGVSYTPATPGNWASPAPTTAQNAIDRIAAVVSGNGATPIP